MRLSFRLIVVAGLLMASLGTAQEGEPEITPQEVVAPPTDWLEGWGGNPPPWFEDAEAIDCEAAPSWCESEAIQDAQVDNGGEGA